MLLVNVPVAVGQQQQFVMNTITKSWCNFTGWNANCWTLYNDDIYFGANGVVCKAWSGLSDNGNNIVCDGLQAFSEFGTPGLLKRYTMMRPLFLTDGNPAIYANLNVDYDISDTTAPLSFSPTTFGVWDTAKWDVDVWGGGLAVNEKWQGVNGIGHAAAPRVKTASQGVQVQWVNTTIVAEVGAVL
jgi:hypothetical protein